jgi:hypothetical protein
MTSDQFDLSQAGRIYGISNTPLFLIRKLQADDAVRGIGESCEPQEILETISAAVATEPATATEAVRPYALLVALWFKADVAHLLAAAKIPAPRYNWYEFVSQALIATFAVVQNQTIQIPGQIQAPDVSGGSAGPTIVLVS